MKTPEVGLAPVRWSVLELSFTHMDLRAFSVLNTNIRVKVLYAHIWIQKDVKAHNECIREDTVIFPFVRFTSQ